MYSVESLRYAIQELFREGIGEDGWDRDEVDSLLDSIDYDALLQAVRHRASTVYSYITQGRRPQSFNYRSTNLFGQKATLLYETSDRSTAEVAVTSRSYELWLLEDMTLTATVRVSVSYRAGEYETVYREIKEGSPWESGLILNLEALAEMLDELCVSVYESEQPVYEL